MSSYHTSVGQERTIDVLRSTHRHPGWGWHTHRTRAPHDHGGVRASAERTATLYLSRSTAVLHEGRVARAVVRAEGTPVRPVDAKFIPITTDRGTGYLTVVDGKVTLHNLYSVLSIIFGPTSPSALAISGTQRVVNGVATVARERGSAGTITVGEVPEVEYLVEFRLKGVEGSVNIKAKDGSQAKNRARALLGQGVVILGVKTLPF